MNKCYRSLFIIAIILLVLIVAILLITHYSFDPPEKITLNEFVLAVTAIIVFVYTSETHRYRRITENTLNQLKKQTKEMTVQTNLLRTSQNLRTLSELIRYFNDLSEIRTKVFIKKEVSLSEVTKLCNFLDDVGHITYRLPPKERDIAIEQ